MSEQDPEKHHAAQDDPTGPVESADEALSDAGRDPDDVLSPEPFRDPNDFAPLPPPRASLGDVLELVWHISFVLLVTVVVPVGVVWGVYRLYRWLPMETMALGIAALAAAWAYRDRLGELAKRVIVGRDSKG